MGKVFDSILENQMCVKIGESVFKQSESLFLGFIVCGHTIRMNPANAQDIVDWPQPKNQNQVQQILALWNFYQRFIPKYAQIVAAIPNLLKGNGKDFKFGECQKATCLTIIV